MSELQRKYELLYILPGNLPGDGIEAVDEILAQTLERLDGETLHREDWGVRTLAYPVKKHAEGRYILLRLACTPECLSELERRLKISEAVIKFLSVRLADDFVQTEVAVSAPVDEAVMRGDDEAADEDDDADDREDELDDDASDDKEQGE